MDVLWDLNDDGESCSPPPATSKRQTRVKMDFFLYENIMIPAVQAMKNQWNREQKWQRTREVILAREIFDECQKPYYHRDFQEMNDIADVHARMRSNFRAAAKRQRKRVNDMRGVAWQLGWQLGLDSSAISQLFESAKDA